MASSSAASSDIDVDKSDSQLPFRTMRSPLLVPASILTSFVMPASIDESRQDLTRSDSSSTLVRVQAT